MKIKVFSVLAFLILQVRGISQVSFTAGNLVVYRVGSGPGTLGNGATAVFLDEYTVAGVLVQSIAMPTTTVGANRALTASGRGDTEGKVTLSTDGQYLVLTGYNAPVGTAGIGGTSSTTRPRTIGLVRYDGDINTTTALTDFSSGNFVRCAVSTNGTDLWACGAGTINSTGGVRYTTVGSTTSTQVTNPVTSTGLLRSLFIMNGQLCVSGNTNSPKIGTVGTGLPTTAGQAITNLTGLPDTIDPGQIALVDLDAGVAGADVLYFTDDVDGVHKYSLVAGSWVSNGTIGSSIDDYRGILAKVSGTTVTLYSTRRGANAINTKGGELVSITDASGYNGAFSATPVVFATAVTNATAFRGMAPAPVLSVVPVKLLSFTAGKINNDVQLNWSVTDAVNFSHFEVERSTDGMTFSLIEKVKYQQGSNNVTLYNCTDAGIFNTAPPGLLYYRLKMVDINGYTEYSKMVTVTTNSNREEVISVWPNPFNNEINVKSGVMITGKINLLLSDMCGRVVARANSIPFYPPAQLPKGTYILRVLIDDKMTIFKLTK